MYLKEKQSLFSSDPIKVKALMRRATFKKQIHQNYGLTDILVNHGFH